MAEREESNQKIKWQNAIWGLTISAQGGLMVALPVIGGLALGYWLDMRFGTLPWITMVITLVMSAIGPLLLFRWVKKVVKQRRQKRQEEENS